MEVGELAWSMVLCFYGVMIGMVIVDPGPCVKLCDVMYFRGVRFDFMNTVVTLPGMYRILKGRPYIPMVN